MNDRKTEEARNKWNSCYNCKKLDLLFEKSEWNQLLYLLESSSCKVVRCFFGTRVLCKPQDDDSDSVTGFLKRVCFLQGYRISKEIINMPHGDYMPCACGLKPVLIPSPTPKWWKWLEMANHFLQTHSELGSSGFGSDHKWLFTVKTSVPAEPVSWEVWSGHYDTCPSYIAGLL